MLVDPEVRFGRPSVRGISTEVLWEHADSGEDTRELADVFDLTASEVQWALAYENAQRLREPQVAGLRWLIITRNSAIQRYRAELAAVRENGARMVALAVETPPTPGRRLSCS